MRGFQLWINLAAKDKMQAASYQDVQAAEIPVARLADGGTVKVIAGTAEIAGKTLAGPIQDISCAALILDVRLPAGGRLQQPLPAEHNAFAYPYEGEVLIGPAATARSLPSQAAGLLSGGEQVEIQAGAEGAAFLLLAARPLQEPIVQHGPFVMNTREEIEQALADYKNGQLV
jgi:redox-sensitive bicupin YhaK (pirin superfamily)